MMLLGWALIHVAGVPKRRDVTTDTNRGMSMWRCRGRQPSTKQGERLPEEINPSDTLIWDFQLTELWENKLNFHCFNHQSLVLCYGVPGELIHKPSHWYLDRFSWGRESCWFWVCISSVSQWLREWAGKLSQYPSSPGWVAASDNRRAGCFKQSSGMGHQRRVRRSKIKVGKAQLQQQKCQESR